jgi:hypothetical protein
MADFLMVVPEGWNEVPNATALVSQAGGEAAVLDAMSQGLGVVDTIIEPAGLPPAGMTVTEARLFKDAENWRLWVTYGPTGN